MEFPLPWERAIWSERSLVSPSTRYGLSDFRLIRAAGEDLDELAVYDIGDVRVARTPLHRILGTWTVTVHARAGRRPPIRISHVRRGPQLAAVLELLASDPLGTVDPAALKAALDWKPREIRGPHRELVTGLVALVATLMFVVIGLQGQAPPPIRYAADDAIRPGGIKRDQADIEAFMEAVVLPWAKTALAPIVGGQENVTCETCHGDAAAARDYRMPAVAALPQPLFRELGWEQHSTLMDPQLRNAIYGYVAESDKQAKATYMREVVMPGMARLLHRPAYDFTRTYEFNRSRQAFGCYHCHRVS
ncbi:MAG: PH domain-containing protein [Vicinamibacterales bacterium]